MAIPSELQGGRRSNPWRIAGWGMAALILLLPFIAMQFTREVAWTAGDFLVAGLLIGCVGLALELVVRASGNPFYRAAAGLALAASFLTIWVNGAVGMIGSEENPYNLLFFATLAAALLGSIVTRFRPAGMAWAMTAAAVIQVAISGGGMLADLRGAILSAAFGAIWLLSAWLFRQAARS